MEGKEISFVTWPDGNVSGESITLGGPRLAIERFCYTYLPERWFGRYSVGYVADTLWKGAREKGFRCHTIVIGKDGEPALKAP